MGARLIILHAGLKDGWVPNCDLVFRAIKYTGDYHDEMSSAHFEEWWVDKLLPNFPPQSLIVMDNAPYHTRCKEEYPVKSWTKTRLVGWLEPRKGSKD